VNAASLQSSASLPAVAAAPVVLWTSGGGGAPAAASAGAVTPAAGQGFQPAGASAPAGQGGAAQAGPAAGSAPAAIPADKGLAAFAQMFGDSFGEPIVAPEGTVYAPAKGVSKSGGKLAVQYIKIGTIDKASGNITFTPEVLAKIQDASQKSERKLVKIDDQYVYETFVTGEDGSQKVAKIEKATEEELKAEQAKQQQAQAEQAAKEKAADNEDWSQKLGQVGQVTGLFGTVGQFVQGLSQGPDPRSGRAGASWLSAYMVANRLNSQSGGKLLPSWFTSGPVSIALDTLVTGYGFLTTGKDLRDVGTALGMAPPLPAVRPMGDVVKDLVAKGSTAADAKMLAELGTSLRTGPNSLIPADESAIAMRGVDQATGRLSELGTSRIPTKVVNQAFNATDPEGAFLTAKLKNSVDGHVNNGIGALGKLVGPAMMVTSGISAVTGVMNVRSIAKKYGVGTLFDTSAGRQALGGAVSSTLYLAMQALPKLLPTMAATPMMGIMGGLNIITNVISGVTFLDRYGLFGDKGFLNHDAIRAAFLIPPLTPIGALAFVMKNRKEKKEAEAKQLEAAKKLQVQQLQQQLKLAQLQLQQSGTISGATKNADGSITFSTGVPVDPGQLVNGAPAASSPPPAAAS
jgi:hypothetical protein